MLAKLILASGSPRRRELLESIGLRFDVVVSDFDESKVHTADPIELVRTLAKSKAHAVANRCPEALVLGADTVVVCDQVVYGKPAHAEDAIWMLSALAGRTHSVYTGICVTCGQTGQTETRVSQTQVTMRHLSEEMIQQYVATGEPMDKAGAYAIQGLGATLVDRIEGCYFTVVGLSLSLTAELLAQFGVEVLSEYISSRAKGGVS